MKTAEQVKIKIPIAIPGDMQKNLDQIASNLNRSRSWLIKSALINFVNSHVKNPELVPTFTRGVNETSLVHFSIYITENLIKWVDIIADKMQRSRNAIITAVIRDYLNQKP